MGFSEASGASTGAAPLASEKPTWKNKTEKSRAGLGVLLSGPRPFKVKPARTYCFLAPKAPMKLSVISSVVSLTPKVPPIALGAMFSSSSFVSGP